MKIFGELSECSSDVLKCPSFHEELLELISGMLIEDTREYTLAQGSASEASVFQRGLALASVLRGVWFTLRRYGFVLWM